MNQTPVISIIGRPNVGKSTIFNRILGNSYKAITHNKAGVTRDRHYGVYKIDELDYQKDVILIDTGGFYPEAKINIEDEMHGVLAKQAEIAIKESDLVLIVVDIRDGLLPFDEDIVNFTRKEKKEFWVIVNKFDSDKQIGEEADFYKFGDDNMFLVSAEHNRGLADLKERITAFTKRFEANEIETKLHGVKPNFKIGGKLALIGAPNVGKSTLLNALVGKERAVVSNIAGTTVDPIEGFIDVDFKNDVKKLDKNVFHFRSDAISNFFETGEIVEDAENLIEEEELLEGEETRRSLLILDTAGIRRRSHIDGFIETQSVYRSLRCIADSDIVLFLIDGEKGITHQDKKLMSIAIDKGKSLLICINKIDLKPEVYGNRREKKEFVLDFEADLPWLNYCRPIFISAQQKKGIETLFKVVKETLLIRKKSIGTSELNSHLGELFDSNPVMVRGGKKGARELKLKYASMVKGSPPTFLLFTNRSMNIPRNYRRYLVNGIRKKFPMPNTPIHLVFRTNADK